MQNDAAEQRAAQLPSRGKRQRGSRCAAALCSQPSLVAAARGSRWVDAPARSRCFVTRCCWTSLTRMSWQLLQPLVVRHTEFGRTAHGTTQHTRHSLPVSRARTSALELSRFPAAKKPPTRICTPLTLHQHLSLAIQAHIGCLRWTHTRFSAAAAAAAQRLSIATCPLQQQVLLRATRARCSCTRRLPRAWSTGWPAGPPRQKPSAHSGEAGLVVHGPAEGEPVPPASAGLLTPKHCVLAVWLLAHAATCG